MNADNRTYSTLNKTYKNILVSAMVNLGDIVLMTGAIALLKQTYPQAKITMLSRPIVREVLENNPAIDEVILLDYKSKNNSLKSMAKMIGKLRSYGFDLHISLDRKLRPALLALLAGIPVRVCPSKVFDDKPSRVTWLYTHTVPITHDLNRTLQFETYQRIIRGFTGTTETRYPVLPTPTAEQQMSARNLLNLADTYEKDSKKIALCVKGTFGLKTYPKEYFVVIANALLTILQPKEKLALFITGAPSDYGYADEVAKNFDAGIVPINLCGKTNLLELYAFLQGLDLFITVDTGAAHIAAVAGTPMITMFGCTSPHRWYPQSKNAIALSSDEPCCPCSYAETACPSYPRPDCLYNLAPEDVIQHAQAILSN